MKQVTFYFDPISPYAALAFEALPEALAGHSVEVIYRPILFAALLQALGQKGPAEIEAKRRWTFRQVAWLAHRQGVVLDPPAQHPFNPLPLLRLSIALGNTTEVIDRLFAYVWRDGHLPDSAADWQQLLDELGASPAQLDTDAVKATLKANGEQAIAAGVFGVPTAAVGRELFWGVDATDMLLACAGGDPFFSSSEYRRAYDLPVSLQRKRTPDIR